MDQQKQGDQSPKALPESSTNEADWQEEAYQKIKVMKDTYLPELNEIFQKLVTKLQEHESLPQTKPDMLEKQKMFKAMLERLISVLQFSKSDISPGLKENLGLYEKQMINFINTNRPRETVSSVHVAPPQLRTAHQPQQPPNTMKMQNQLYQSHRSLPETSSTSLDSPAQTVHTDWQEEAYQKIKFMKEIYLPELNEMFQKLANKLQEFVIGSSERLYLLFNHRSQVALCTNIDGYKHESLPQTKPDMLEKQKMLKAMLERLISVLQFSKSDISPGLKENLGLYEKQMINFINTNRPRETVSSVHVAPPQLRTAHQPQQPPNTMKMQNQLYQSHRSLPETSSTSLDSPAQTVHTDWQEEAYQKIIVMKQLYFSELSEAYWKISTKLQLDSHLQQQTSDQHQKLNMFKNMLEHLITVLHYSKTDISLDLKEKLVSYEKQIIDFINTNRLRYSL